LDLGVSDRMLQKLLVDELSNLYRSNKY
jgi:hypothetical protein